MHSEGEMLLKPFFLHSHSTFNWDITEKIHPAKRVFKVHQNSLVLVVG